MKRFVFNEDLITTKTTHGGGGWHGWNPDTVNTIIHFKKGDEIEVCGTYIDSPIKEAGHFCIFSLLRQAIITPLDEEVKKAWEILSK